MAHELPAPSALAAAGVAGVSVASAPLIDEPGLATALQPSPDNDVEAPSEQPPQHTQTQPMEDVPAVATTTPTAAATVISAIRTTSRHAKRSEVPVPLQRRQSKRAAASQPVETRMNDDAAPAAQNETVSPAPKRRKSGRASDSLRASDSASASAAAAAAAVPASSLSQSQTQEMEVAEIASNTQEMPAVEALESAPQSEAETDISATTDAAATATDSSAQLVTPDGRYIVVRGRLWRRSNPSLSPEEHERLTRELMQARRDKSAAMRAGDAEAREQARQRCEAAKVALGERGPVWWDDGAPDLTRKMAHTQPAYAAWFASVSIAASAAVSPVAAVPAAAAAVSVEAVAAVAAAAPAPKKRGKKIKTPPVYDASDYHPQALVSRKFVGAHVSAAGGPQFAVYNASQIGARAFAMDTRSKRKWTSPPLSEIDAAAFREALKAHNYTPDQVLPHGSYLMNLGSPNAEVLAKSQLCLLAELERCGQLGVTHYNFHPGSTCNLITKEACMDLIASSLNAAHKATSHLNGGRGVVTVLECMAGQGGVVGSTFEELAYIVTRIDDKTRVGVCVDTCHAFAAGIDLRTEADVTNMLAHLDATVGLKYLRGFHFNDSKGELNCRKDRHESIGQGCIGSAGFRALMNHPALDGLPLILETPCPDLTQQRAKYANEIAFLYAMESEAVPENREGRPLPYNPPSKEQLDEKKEVRKKMLEQKRNDKKKKKKKAVEEEEEEVEEDEDEVEEEDEDDKPLVRAASSSKESKPKLKRSQSAPSTAAAATAAAVDRNGSKKKKAKVTKRDVVPEEDEDEQDDAFMEDNDGGEEAAAPVPTPALKRGKSAVPAAAAAAGNGKLKKAHSKAT